jgi:hypothetical protein
MRSNLRSLAHLEEQLGEELFGRIISSDNTGAVREFARQLPEALPTEMTVGGRTYEILRILEGDEKSVKGNVMVARATENGANLGEDDGQHLLDHRDEIPVAFRGKVVFIFTGWRLPGGPGNVRYVYWSGGRWAEFWGWLVDDFGEDCRVLRRK